MSPVAPRCQSAPLPQSPLAALGLLSVAVFGGETPLWAQEAESTGVGISLDGLSSYPTHLTVDGFEVELTNLTSVVAYEVVVSSDSARVGIGGCGTRSRRATVTGVTERELVYLVYACTEGEATVTAEVRRTGAASAEASVSQRLTVEAIPENAIGARGQRVRAPAAGAVPKVGTPGSVPNTYFSHRYLTSVRANWEKPSDGGRKLTGFGLLFWREADGHPGYDNPLIKGKDARNHTYTNRQPDTTYNFQIHACNGPDSCGYWTVPIVVVKTAGPPKMPHSTSVPDEHVEARSAQVTWSPDADTGGPDMQLTGFGILWREEGDDWDYGDAVDVDRNKRNYTMTGLLPSTTYEVIVQSCNGTDSCSPWNNPNDPVSFTTDEPERIVDRPPGSVLNLSVTGRNQQLVVDWDAPTARGSSALTNYTLQYKRQSTTAWTSFPAITAPNAQAAIPTQATITSLTNGTTYDVQVQACNANTSDRCGAWVQGSGTPTATVTAPNQVDPPSVSSGLNRLTVDWDAPDDGGSPITRYDVQHVAKPTPPPTPPPAPSWPADDVAKAVTGGTSTSIGSLTNDTTYLVRVRACNAKGCGDYSEPRDGTPRAIAPTRLARPSNLNVEPLPGRMARLTWNAVTGATGYIVQFRQHGLAWPAAGTVDNRTVTTASIEIDLDSILRIIDRSVPANPQIVPHKGLGEASAFDFRVQATDSSSSYRDSYQSQTVIIIDTPITAANGYSNAGDEARVSWMAIDDNSILGSDYNSGTYEIRYKETNQDHTQPGWQPHEFDPAVDPPNVSMLSDTSAKIGTLNLHKIYAIQLIKRNTGPASDQMVFAARDVYVWPSNRPAKGGERVATFPLRQRLTERTGDGRPLLNYRICDDTFSVTLPPGSTVVIPANHTVASWIELIEAAMGHWTAATSDLIATNREIYTQAEIDAFTQEDFDADPRLKNVKSGDFKLCAQYKAAVDAIANKVAAGGTDKQLKARILGLLVNLDFQIIIDEIRDKDAAAVEILMFDDFHGPLATADRVGAFPQIADHIGYAKDCWYGSSKGNMCVIPPEGGKPSDMIIRRDPYKKDALEKPVSGASFNRCGNDSDDHNKDNSAYVDLVHEIAHFLGIGGGSGSGGWHLPSHPQVPDSAVNYDWLAKPMSADIRPMQETDFDGNFVEPDCGPHPLDIMAIYALYQIFQSP